MRILGSAVPALILYCFVALAPGEVSGQASTAYTPVGGAQEPGTLPEALAGNQPGDTLERDIQALRQLEANYLRAEMEDNTTLAAAIMADDYIGIRGDGSSSSKDEVLGNLAKHERQRRPLKITAVNMREHVFGDTACVTYTKVYTQPQTRAAYTENVMHVFTKRNGQWHLQVSTPIPTPRPLSVPQGTPPPQR